MRGELDDERCGVVEEVRRTRKSKAPRRSVRVTMGAPNVAEHPTALVRPEVRQARLVSGRPVATSLDVPLGDRRGKSCSSVSPRELFWACVEYGYELGSPVRRSGNDHDRAGPPLHGCGRCGSLRRCERAFRSTSCT